MKCLFDNIDHELLMRVVRRHVKEVWICLQTQKETSIALAKMGMQIENIASAVNADIEQIKCWISEM